MTIVYKVVRGTWEKNDAAVLWAANGQGKYAVVSQWMY